MPNQTWPTAISKEVQWTLDEINSCYLVFCDRKTGFMLEESCSFKYQTDSGSALQNKDFQIANKVSAISGICELIVSRRFCHLIFVCCGAFCPVSPPSPHPLIKLVCIQSLSCLLPPSCLKLWLRMSPEICQMWLNIRVSHTGAAFIQKVRLKKHVAYKNDVAEIADILTLFCFGVLCISHVQCKPYHAKKKKKYETTQPEMYLRVHLQINVRPM